MEGACILPPPAELVGIGGMILKEEGAVESSSAGENVGFYKIVECTPHSEASKLVKPMSSPDLVSGIADGHVPRSLTFLFQY